MNRGTLSEMGSISTRIFAGQNAGRRCLWGLVTLQALWGCRGTRAPATWDDLFHGSAAVTVLDTDFAWVWSDLDGLPAASVEDIPDVVETSALRNGHLIATRRSNGGATTVAHARRLGASFPVPPAVGDAPYWGKGIRIRQIAVVSGRRTYVASSLFYPIRVYDLGHVLRDSLTAAPRSWHQARRPRSGEFANVGEGAAERIAALDAYLLDLTMITGMAAIADSVLIVNHGVYRREQDGVLHVEPSTVDVYVKGERIASDLPSPGAVVAFSPNSVFVLAAGSSRREPMLVEYEWRGGYEP